MPRRPAALRQRRWLDARRSHRAAALRLPGVRRRGGMVAREASARLPVLRSRLADAAGHRCGRRGAGARSRDCAAEHPGERSRLADGDAFGEMPKLPGDLGLQTGTRGAELRLLRFTRARPVRGDKGADPARERPAVQAQRRAMCATKCAPGIAAAGSRRIVSRAARSPTRCTAFICPTGRSTRRSPREWTADAGHYYYTTETYRDSKGNTQTRQVRHTRWEPASGSLEHFFDDELVRASQGVPADLLKKIEPFPTDEPRAVRRRLRLRLGRRAIPDRSRRRGDSIRAKRWTRSCASSARRRSPATRIAISQVDADYSAQTFKHVLLPLWLLTYQYGAKTFRIVVQRRDRRDRRQISEELDQDRPARHRHPDRDADHLRLRGRRRLASASLPPRG